MLATYSHSRAAILCLGGWGLQVMLHLAPRLHAAQEHRAALGAIGPDLNRISSLGAALPDPILSVDGHAQFHLRRLHPDQVLPPFHIERVLADLDNSPASAGEDPARFAALTASERRAVRLLRALEQHLAPIAYDNHPFQIKATGLSMQRPSARAGDFRRASRAELFEAALIHADYVARLLEIHLLDPIREDRLAPDDPFVQTTLYVVAPLFEPLTSAMIWPIVGGLMARFGRRHISNVVALCATGSYARDLTRSVEDATAYAALSELEVLSGLRDDARAREFLKTVIADTGSDLAGHVGEKLFDHIYLLDREKSNQGLSEDSHELAVLAGNALEALIVGSGDMYLQEQLGFHVHSASPHPYSLIGASSDYVPLDQMLHAVNRQEESRLVRDWVLRSTPEEPAASATNPLLRRTGQQPNLSLSDLGFSQARALHQLALRLPALFANEEPQRIEDLDISTGFIMPTSAAAKLRRLSAHDWRAGFEQHLSEVEQTFTLAVGSAAIDEAWGISLLNQSEAGLSVRHEADDRLVPQLLTNMHKRLVDLLSASPTGLTRARAQTQRWLQETEEALQKLQINSTPSMRKLEDVQNDLARREWALQYDETSAKLPTASGILLRGTASVLFVALLAVIYLFIAGANWNQLNDGLALAGFATGILLAGLFSYRYAAGRRSKLRHARVDLARTELSARLRAQVYDGLRQTYHQLADILHGWHDMLGEAMDELHALSTPPRMPAVPPVGVPQTYLYQPHINQKLWDQCLAFLRSHLDSHGQRSEERLDQIWGETRWRTHMQQILRQSAQSAGGRAQARAIAEFIRQTVRKSVAPVSLERMSSREISPLRAQLVRSLAREFTVEHMLWRGAAEAQDIERRLRAMAMSNTETEANNDVEVLTNRRYVESAWHRAKPTANYDVADRLAVYGITVDFAAISGTADSDLTRALLEEFNIALLPTENPFVITFVRTVHGLSLEDLDCMRRYRAEIRTLTRDERALLMFVNAPVGSLYRTPMRSTASDDRPPRPSDPPIHENA